MDRRVNLINQPQPSYGTSCYHISGNSISQFTSLLRLLLSRAGSLWALDPLETSLHHTQQVYLSLGPCSSQTLAPGSHICHLDGAVQGSEL